MRLAFVTPRYGSEMVGGAEAMVREQAHGLAERGHEVEVLTTVATDAQTWVAALEPGVVVDGPVTVRRFPLAPGVEAARRDALDHLVLSGRPLSVSDELAWADARFEVPALARHLTEEGGGYEAVVYSPYLSWTTLRCLPLTRARSVLIPCLHDEPPARLGIVRAALAAAADVWFLSEPEHQLAHRLIPLGPHRVIGSGVHEPRGTDPDGFRQRHGITRPFALYAGRREDGKGWPQALAGFSTAVDRHGLTLDLVTFGAGAPVGGERLGERVIDLGFLDEQEVPSAFAAASVFLQPSPNESFSRTVMEAWLAGVPVVATWAGEVVAWHCEQSGGGLLYGDEIEMAECIRTLVDDPDAAAELGAAGRRYVRASCAWPAVLDRIEEALAAFRRPPGGLAPSPMARQLAAEVRERTLQDRRSIVGMTAGFPLATWLPAPGAGVPGASPARDLPGVTGAPGNGDGRGRLGRVAVRGVRRWPRARALVGAARAARSAWASERAVAQPRDVR